MLSAENCTQSAKCQGLTALFQVPQMDLPLLDGTELIMNLGATDEPPLVAQDLLPPASTPIEPREKRRRSRRKQDKDKRFI